jgi:tetratricopeptide (TPR) repeat protein
MAASLQQLAYLYTALGRYSEATDLYNRSLAILQSCLDSSHPDITDALNKLAWLQLKCGTRRLNKRRITDIVRKPSQLIQHCGHCAGNVKKADEIYGKLSEDNENSLGKEVTFAPLNRHRAFALLAGSRDL